jgi:hypothetical protein
MEWRTAALSEGNSQAAHDFPINPLFGRGSCGYHRLGRGGHLLHLVVDHQRRLCRVQLDGTGLDLCRRWLAIVSSRGANDDSAWKTQLTASHAHTTVPTFFLTSGGAISRSTQPRCSDAAMRVLRSARVSHRAQDQTPSRIICKLYCFLMRVPAYWGESGWLCWRRQCDRRSEIEEKRDKMSRARPVYKTE